MIIRYYFYNPENHSEDEYEWDCFDNDDVFKELVDYYVEMYGVEYDTAWDTMVDDEELRERIFDEAYYGLQEMFEKEAYDSYLEEVVYSW